MPKLNEKEYECDECHQVFQFEITDQQAEEQFKQEFPDDERDPLTDGIVCEDCFREIFGEKE